MLANALCGQRFSSKSLRVVLAACVLSMFALHPVWADDTEIYFNSTASTAVKPNLLFILDASLSMDNYDCTLIKSNRSGCPADDTTENATSTRLERMVAAMKVVLETMSDDYNVGLMRFGGFDGGRIIYPITDLAVPGSREDLGAMLEDIVTIIGTPTVGAFEEAFRYYSGSEVKHGLKRPLTPPGRALGNPGYDGLEPDRWSRISHPDSHNGEVVQPIGCSDDDLDNLACQDEEVVVGEAGTPPTYISPIVSECQSSYAIMLSDGAPWVGWRNQPAIVDAYNDTIAMGKNFNSQVADGGEESCVNVGVHGLCGEEYTAYMKHGDVHPMLPGKQNVTTHTIGFNISNNWTKDLATAGGGNYYEAESSADLVGVISDIVSSVSDSGVTIAAPSATIDQFSRLSHRQEMYLSLFKPQSTARWLGNLKKFKLAGENASLKDKDGKEAIDAATGAFIPESRSYWSNDSDVPDGGDILLGGAANHLNPANRRIVSDLQVTSDSAALVTGTQTSNPNEINENNTHLSDALLGFDTPDETPLDKVCFFDNSDWTHVSNLGANFKACATQSAGNSDYNGANFRAWKGHTYSVSAISTGDSVHAFIYSGRNATGESLCVPPGTGIPVLGDLDNRARSFKLGVGACPVGSTIAEREAPRDVLIPWLRGVDVEDEDNDDSIVDARNHIGDPLHSSPVVVTYGVEDGETLDKDNLNSLVFFGTNEGFLHAIDTRDGSEEYAFMPKELLKNVPALFANTVIKRDDIRPYGLDGDITVRQIDNNKNGLIESDDFDVAQLYIGMRRGGRNYYSLDVSAKSNPKFEWSILGGTGDFTELGQSWSKPILTKVKVGTTVKDVLVFGGGYDPGQDDKTVRSADTQGRAIFIVDADTGALIWSGGNYGTPATTKHVNFSGMDYSIPANVAVVADNKTGYMSQMYVGDMGGQLWRFDVHNGTTESNIDDLVTGDVIASLAGDTQATARRFYGSPDVSLTKVNGELKLNIAIGSGYRAHPLNTVIDDRFYALQYPFAYADAYNETAGYDEITDLFDATSNVIAEGEEQDKSDAKEELADKQGWFIDLEDSGEKVFDRSSTFQGVVRFVSYVPAVPTGPCDPSLGTSYYYAVNLLDGTPFEDPNEDSANSHKKENRRGRIPGSGIAPPVSTLFVKGEDGTTITPIDLVGANKVHEWEDVSKPQRWFWAENPD